MTGGAGADSFVFAAAAETRTQGVPDHITDFTTKADKIDMSFFSGAVFIGAAAFSNVAGQVRYTKATGTLEADFNADSLADFTVILDNHGALVAADLIL